MAIFKWRSRSKKVDTKDNEKPEGAGGEQPAPAPYRHIPKHAGSDAASGSTEKATREKIRAASQNRISAQARDYAKANNGSVQNTAHSAQQGLLSPPAFSGQYPGAPHSHRAHLQRNQSAEVFVTDPDAPPMPTSPNPSAGRNYASSGHPRTDYFGSSYQRPSFDSPIMGSIKMQTAARDRGYLPPHYSGDSGYGSVVHSRAPSEQIAFADANGHQLPRTNSGFLPELNLGDELGQEPAWSEGSNDYPAPHSPKKAPEGVLKSSKNYLERRTSQLDDSRSLKSSRSRSTLKQTRFENAPELVTHNVQHDPQISHNKQTTSMTEARPESTTLPEHDLTPNVGPREHHATEYSHLPFSLPERHSTPPLQSLPDHQAHYRASSPLPTSNQAPPFRYFSSPPGERRDPIERVVSPLPQQDSAPPLSRLEGFKVNKRGIVLDEEGDPIGELFEGDIIDCVRQKVNSVGDVLDENGTVVGRVRPLHRSEVSPMMRMSSPAPSIQQQYAHMYTPRPMSPALSVRSREGQQEVFTPAWQRQFPHQRRPSLANELRDHLAQSTEEYDVTSVRAGATSENTPAVELPAQEVERGRDQAYEEELPIFDHSDAFMPPSMMKPPAIPTRSPQRPETPSPPLSPQIKEPQQAAMEHSTWLPPTSQAHFQPEAPPEKETSKDVSESNTHHAEALPPMQQNELQPAPPNPVTAVESPSPAVTASQVPKSPRLLARSASDSNMSVLTKSYSKPTVSSVPEDSQLQEDDRSQARFSYKGEIPTGENPMQGRLAPPRSLDAMSPPPSLNIPNQTHPQMSTISSMPFQAPMAAHYSSAGRLKAPRSFSTGVPGPRPFSGRTAHSFHAPMRRSPLSSHENSPPESDQGSDGDKNSQLNGMYGHNRQPSVRTMHSTYSMPSAAGTVNKPRTYFTHGGKVTVQSGESGATAAAKMAAVNKTADESKPAAAASGPERTPTKKKKSRFSLGFGKKS
ncbi:hypothetical protein KC332_g8710 [Hortaea werneckii]|uniref:Uncharacterized protein n=2 Tax=Hortaea werneckii TaxID=91943 RepID=A0A3M7J2Z4_HORWE|nr:hypothetical protein KC358_g15684 [Hortaea werneckii]KAI6903211.1 hypothetical protein KC348_g15767 [Hortaea werneckii]KAI6921510.1 hypothetical protein KC341_g15906 [Hortaea werneckii]KAI6955612.1 hypothetical protein KC321_g15654 [Hortaea werneckii]KAI6963949.1 hypothetical protein KC329_g15769 [Hortaea werneckii]